MAGELAKADTTTPEAVHRPSRLGWEFWERPPPSPFPLEHDAPQAATPRPPDLAEITKRHRDKLEPGVILLCLGVLLLLGIVGSGPGQMVVAGALGAVGIALVTARPRAVHQAKADHNRAVAAAEAAYRPAEAYWRSQRDAWYADEARRLDAIPTYYVLHQVDHRRRLDVFGGQPAGWACLLNTIARPLIDDSVGVSLLDFTESSIGVELCAYAAETGHRVRYGFVPGELPRMDLLQGLGADEVAAVLVAASHAVRDRRGREDQEQHEVDTAIVAEVCRIVEPGGLTVARIVAGLDIANQALGSGSGDALAAAERTALEESGYLTASGARMRDRYPYLRSRLGALAAMATEGSLDAVGLPRAGEVSILATDGGGDRELSVAANLSVQCLSRRLHGHRVAGPAPLVMVAGADLLTVETVTRLARNASRAGVRSVFLFRNLEDDARRLLGTEGSDTMFFQLQNHEQAQVAADFVGRRYRFVVGQISKSVGDSLGGSQGENRSWTAGVTEGAERGASYSGLLRISTSGTSRSTSSGESWSEATGTQWSTQWQKTETYGETATRVYEYDTEPRVLQELDVSCFVLVSRVGGRTKVAAGDCNPGLERLRYAADYQREVCPLRGDPTPIPPTTPATPPP
ncbi:MAG: hypothetical protein ACRD2C_04605, partial [Acidimicrobiales bacterium]